MILKFDQRIFEGASADPGRYAMHGVLFRQADDGAVMATATDGKTLTRIEVQLQDGEKLPDEGVLLDARDLKSGWGRGKGDRILRILDGSWKLGVANQVTEISVIDGEFPKVEAVIPAPASGQLLTFDVKLLLQIAKAAGADSVTLEVPEFATSGKQKGQITSPIRVRLRDTFSEHDLGVLMPITVD
jgi:DNA polymerase III sliding clamp (beta) subunit (PCNA family)